MKLLAKIAFLVFFLSIIYTCKKEEPLVNKAPEISEIQVTPSGITTNSLVTLTAIATDPEGDKIEYIWNCSTGSFKSAIGQSVNWTAPAEAGKITVTLTVSDGKLLATKSTSIDVIAAIGGLSVTSTPVGASIYLDGVDSKQITPYTFSGLSVGRKIVSVVKTGYLSDRDTISVNIQNNVVSQANFILNPIASLTFVDGYVYYSGTKIPVSGVTVSINNKSFTTNITGSYILTEIAAGNVELVASKPDYDPYRKSIILNSGANHIDIEITSGIYTHTINGTVSTSIGTKIHGVTVSLLNGDNTDTNISDQTDANGNYQLPAIPQGQMKIEFSIGSFDSIQKDIFVSNSNRIFDVALKAKLITPINPILVSNTLDNNQIKWSSSYGPELLSFNVYRSKDQSANYVKINPSPITFSSDPPTNGFIFYNDPVDNTFTPTYYKISIVNVDSYEGPLSNSIQVNPILSKPFVTSSIVTNLTTTSATLGGNITSDGGALVTERGVYWSSNPNSEKFGSKLMLGNDVGSFSTIKADLSPNTQYFNRAYAINSLGISYGNEISFTTLTRAITKDIYLTSSTTANCYAWVSFNGNGIISEHGVCWSTNTNPTIDNYKTTVDSETQDFACGISGLMLGTQYFVRAFATNSGGTAYGVERSITTSNYSSISTISLSQIKDASVTCEGNISSDGGAPIIERGFCWSIYQNPVVTGSHLIEGTGSGSFTSSITGLTPSTTYYIRAYSINSVGISYGNELSFKTYDILTDGSGNAYSTVTIGNLTWMDENLKTTNYNDGTTIPLVTDPEVWKSLSTPAYCWNLNDVTYKDPYGALYNWYAVKTRKLCPTGWHVPSDAEWKTLEMYLGMTLAEVDAKGFRGTDQGTQLKSSTGWYWGENGTNSSGFSALPSGSRSPDGSFQTIGAMGLWWSATEASVSEAWSRWLWDQDGEVYRWEVTKVSGYSVRCVRDN